MIRHISRSHEKCPSCDICAKYFGTNKLLEDHNMKTHIEKDIITDNDREDVALIESADENITKSKNLKKKN